MCVPEPSHDLQELGLCWRRADRERERGVSDGEREECQRERRLAAHPQLLAYSLNKPSQINTSIQQDKSPPSHTEKKR